MLAFLERLFALLGPSPHAALLEMAARARGGSFPRYRFVSPDGVGRFLLCTGLALTEHGSLERLFASGKKDSLRESLARFLFWFRAAWPPGLLRERDFLFPDPMRGSACKRHNLFLRWVVRPDDGIDLGLWSILDPRDLVVPLDTHVARFSRWLCLTRRKGANWRAAEEITAALARVSPHDPLRYDFALARLGIAGLCGGRRPGPCAPCPLRAVCRRAAADFGVARPILGA